MADTYMSNIGDGGSDEIEESLLTRLNTLVEILEEMDIGSDIYSGGDGLPYILTRDEDSQMRFAVMPVDEENERFILYITLFLLESIEEDGITEADSEAALICNGFNMSSSFGYAVYVQGEGRVELRLQLLEDDGIFDVERTGTILDMLSDSAGEFLEMWDEAYEDYLP